MNCNEMSSEDLIVERDKLRRSSREEQLDVSSVMRKLIPVEPDLHSWIRSQESYILYNSYTFLILYV